MKSPTKKEHAKIELKEYLSNIQVSDIRGLSSDTEVISALTYVTRHEF
jgi:hypothetical protein